MSTGLNLVESGNRDAGARAAIDELRATIAEIEEETEAGVVIVPTIDESSTASSIVLNIKESDDDLLEILAAGKNIVLNMVGALYEETDGALPMGMYPLVSLETTLEGSTYTNTATFSNNLVFTSTSFSDPMVATITV